MTTTMTDDASGGHDQGQRVPPVITEFYALVDAGDTDGLCALFAPDAHYVRPGYPDLHSREAIAHFYRYDRVISSGRHTLDHAFVDCNGPDARIAVCGSFAGRKRDGSAVAHRFAEFFTLGSEGLFTERETFFAIAHV